jgi:NitT/TauT family transport system permease protein
MKKIWIRKKISASTKFFVGSLGILLSLIVWITITYVRMPVRELNKSNYDYINTVYPDEAKILFDNYYKETNGKFILKNNLTTKQKLIVWNSLKTSKIIKSNIPNPIIELNILPHPFDVIKAFPVLIKGTTGKGIVWENSLLFAIGVSLTREIVSFIIVIIFALLLGIFMSVNGYIRAFYMPFLVVGTFIPIAALIPLTQAFFGIGETQKIVFLSLGMFFVLLALVMKEMDEVDEIYLQTAYTLGFSQIKTVFLINFPIALPRIWKHFAAVFGLGWGYIIFAEMINQGSSDIINGIGWLFIARKRRGQIPDMYAIFFVIIFLAFLFSYLFDLLSKILFKHERHPHK